MQLSMNTLMLAIKAMQRDIKRYEEMLQDENLSEADSDYYGQYVLDLTLGCPNRPAAVDRFLDS